MELRLGISLMLMVVGCEGARILVFYPIPSWSHHVGPQALVRELALRGHQVTFYTPFPLEDPPPNLSQIILPLLIKEMRELLGVTNPSRMTKLSFMSNWMYNNRFLQFEMCQVKEVQDLVHSDEKFDLVILESLLMQDIFSAFQHKFNAPSIELLPAGGLIWGYHFMGSPYNPSYFVSASRANSDRMSFESRLGNTVETIIMILMGLWTIDGHQDLMDSCLNYTGYETRPPIGQLMREKALILQNTHVSLSYPHPVSPTIIDVGGLHIKPPKTLPQDLKNFMDEATEGVVYFSLGSLVHSNEAFNDTLQVWLSTFRRLKQRVLWKWEGPVIPDKPDNVLFGKWFPQQDILRHKNCKLFIFQGGFLSMTEAVAFGVPVVGIPYLGDQDKDMVHAETYGYGLKVDRHNITEEILYNAVTEVLNNPKYKAAVDVRSKLFHDRPMTGLETAVYWVEYVARHKGASHLRSASLDLHWYQYLLLDVILTLGLITTISIIFCFYITKKLLCFVSRKIFPKKQPKQKKK